MNDSPVTIASAVPSLSVQFTNAARDDAGNVTYNIEADLSGDAIADYTLLRAIMDGDTDIFASPEFSGLDPSEIDALQTRLIDLAVADQNMVANQLQRWMVNPMYQNNFNAGLGGPSFHTDDFDPSSLNRNIGEDYIGVIQKAVNDMHQNGVPQDQALATLAADSENILNGVSAKIEEQMNVVRDFAANNDVRATIVSAGTEITGASPVSATITNDSQAMYELFRNLDDTNLAASPVYLALNADGRDALKAELIGASNEDYRHVTASILPFIQNATNAPKYFNVEHEGNLSRTDPNRDLGPYNDLIAETIGKFEGVGFDRSQMGPIIEDFKARADEIKQGQVDMIGDKLDTLAAHDRTHDVVALNVPSL